MPKSLLVSIIIPTFNRAHIISETLDSVLQQTYQDWECIIVDDGSNDNTDKVINLFTANDSRFKFYSRPKHRKAGGNAARNIGLEKSKGQLIQWFDSDDIMFEDYLQKRVEIFELYPETDVVFCGFTYFDSKEIQERQTNITFSGRILKDLIEKKISFSPLSYLLKKNTLKGQEFDEDLKRAQDLDFFFRVFTARKNIVIKHIPAILFKVRKHSKAISGEADKRGEKLNSRFIVNQRLLDYFVEQHHDLAIEKYKKQSLKELKRLLDNKNYRLVINNILNFRHVHLNKKIVLLTYTVCQIIIGKGSEQFKKVNL